MILSQELRLCPRFDEAKVTSPPWPPLTALPNPPNNSHPSIRIRQFIAHWNAPFSDASIDMEKAIEAFMK